MMNLTPCELETKMIKWATTFTNKAKQCIEAEEEFNNLYRGYDDLLAKLTKQAEGKSKAEKETNARLTEEWQAFMRGYGFAEDKYRRLKMEKEVADMWWQTIRSLLSSKNAERRTNT